MTVKSGGSLAMNEINDEYGRGTNLNSYRNTGRFDPWDNWGNFSGGSIGFADFYNTSNHRKTVSVVPRNNDANAYRPGHHVWNYESLAYVGIAWNSSSSSESYQYYNWDGVGSDHQLSAVDNGDSEHKGIAMALKNVYADDYDKTMLGRFSTNADFYCSLALVGGSSGWGCAWASARGSGPSYPITYDLYLLKNDVVVSAGNHRTNGGQTQFWMNLHTSFVYGDGSRRLFYYIVPSEGSYQFTLTASDNKQQWCDITAIYRGGGFG
jgi:hypothetical protein